MSVHISACWPFPWTDPCTDLDINSSFDGLDCPSQDAFGRDFCTCGLPFIGNLKFRLRVEFQPTLLPNKHRLRVGESRLFSCIFHDTFRAGVWYATQAPDQFNKHKTMLVKKLRRIVGLYNWKTDETRPRPCKRENLKLGANRSTGKFAGKVPGKFTGDNPAIDLNPALDSVGPNSPTLRTRTVRVLGGRRLKRVPTPYIYKTLFFIHTDVRVCPSAQTGRPWPSVSTHRTSVAVRQHTQDVRLSISTHISTLRGCSGDFGPRGLSVQYTQDVRQHTQDVRGCPCVSVCPSVHTGRPSAHTGRPSAHAGRPSAHAGRPRLSVCVRVSVSAHRTSVSTHRTSVSTRRTSVSPRRTSVAVRVCPCVSVCPSVHTGRPSAHTGRPSAHTGRPSAHAGRPWLSVCVCPSVHTGRPSAHTGRPSARTSVSTRRTSEQSARTDSLRFGNSDWTGRTDGYGTARRSRWAGSWPIWFLKQKDAIFMSFYESK
ncbi:hypothetical protein IGI04_036637 [Brassica rapa subsp. trilocularis]|uniref:Uncharacterized protein n=1 Tax=Brassica rapa subsp. trilocularis TaxID=1813537 RepID=A0ABQ7LG13_BRACM|nr:hypothetical protein IGI04_036637 [Brassica rapa subsp. trilocularis]